MDQSMVAVYGIEICTVDLPGPDWLRSTNGHGMFAVCSNDFSLKMLNKG
jgi:hypothetical protein